jgi:predicted nuclease of predicted toxin-antitoxin system
VTSSDSPTFFIDWCLGKTVAQALIDAGVPVEHHGDHFSQDTFDTEWLPVVSDRDWVVLTKDQAIGKNELELKAIARAGAKVFILVSGNLTRQQMADIFVSGIAKVERMTRGNQAPFIAKIYKDGRVVIWQNRTKLLKLLKQDDSSV